MTATSGPATKAQSKWLSKSAARTRGSDQSEVQFHYDISNDFFKLWQDPTQTYSCAYFERDDMTLEHAQIAKIDLAPGKLNLAPGMTLLDVGFIAKEIFPGGSVPCDDDVIEYSGAAGFSVREWQDLTPDYVRTLDTWATKLEDSRDRAIAVTSQQTYDRYRKYLLGCSNFFQRNVSYVGQLTLVKGE